MQFQSIIATLAFAIAATAVPAPAPAPVPVPVPNAPTGGTAQNQCAAGSVAACCNGVGNLLNLQCTALVLSELISSQCSSQQTVTCCNDPNAAGGTLINVQASCIPITVL